MAWGLAPVDAPNARSAAPHRSNSGPCPTQPAKPATSGAFEVLFTDTEGRLTEGSFTCLFVERDGKLLTPPLARGLLPGVLRRALIEEGRAVEADLTPADLSGGFLIGNSLRGLMRAVIA